MNRVLNFLRESEVFYIATVEGDYPRLRPFDAVMKFENRLYIQTGREKDVYHQLKANPHVEICTAEPGRKWIRIMADAYEDDRREARCQMLKCMPFLKNRYNADDGKMTVFYLTNIKAAIYTNHAPTEVIECDDGKFPPQDKK